MTPKAHKKSNAGKEIRVCKAGTAAQAIGVIEKNTDTFVLTYGQFSLIDALIAILDQTGPAHVNVSTWTAAHADLTRSAQMLETVEILSFRMIVDRSFKTRQPKYYYHMIKLFGQDCIREIRTHAKFITVRNDDYDIVIRTSMNLNSNPRLENIEVSENAEFAEFFERIVDDVFREVSPGEQKSDIPGLESIEDSLNFKLVKADHIERRSLNEPKYTHTIDKY
jgi:hypothetical protein